MTDRIAFGLAAIIFVAVGLDLAFGWGGSVFLLRRFLDLVRWVAFWR
ncbi:hypothetical protein [Falsirhodobacter algicola]|uniref:Uncharacterized protein n=1 Tax=Falsirhodobacter algicola TaxID=2692330 RepID=A0A8J8MSR8_9RHOB|nr:hypothetical protein [Falsirhodobacter algicola]QUS35736.1 hypothetical protein GR316_05340 [Falsirhodobacter algicola]